MLIFPDTNFFLQCKAPAEIPWCDVTEDDEVRLVVCRTVQGEIDRFKGDGRGRRSDRARTVSSWFAKVITEGGALSLRNGSPKVTLELSPRIGRSHIYPPDLDVARSDDRIVGEVLAHPAEDAVLLTGDTGMMATARDEGLTFLPIPDAWRLPPEPDAEDKQIADMQKRLAILERMAPALELKTGSTRDGLPIISRTQYQQLPGAVIEELLGATLLQFPAKTDFSLEADLGYAASKRTYAFGSMIGAFVDVDWQPPAPDAIAEYRARHAAWGNAVRDRLRGLHSLLPGTRGMIRMLWSLANTGTVPAEGLIVEIEALGGLCLVEVSALPSLKERSTAFPATPPPPEWKPVSRVIDRMGSLQSMLKVMSEGYDSRGLASFEIPTPRVPHMRGSPDDRDSQSFYWRDKPSKMLSRRWEYECAEFRHGRAAEVFEAVLLAPMNMAGGSGAVRFRASARNLPTALEETTRVGIEAKVGDTEAEARLLVSKARQFPDQDF